MLEGQFILLALFLYNLFSIHSYSNQVSQDLAPPEALETYTQLSSHPLHKTNKPGILSVDVHQSKVAMSVEDYACLSKLYDWVINFSNSIIGSKILCRILS